SRRMRPRRSCHSGAAPGGTASGASTTRASAARRRRGRLLRRCGSPRPSTASGGARRMLDERLTREDGFGLVELMIAMTVMAIGIAAIVSGFSSGILAVSRASQTSTAGPLADKQMEAYRAIPYKSIMVTPTSDSTYAGDPAIAPPLFALTTTTSPGWSTDQYDGTYCAGTTQLSAGSSVNATSVTVNSTTGL